MFEKASKQKLRFSFNGQLRTEDLWDLKLEDLDTIAKALNKEVDASAETSFIKKKSTSNAKSELKFDIVKHIIEVKLAAKDAKLRRAESESKRDMLRGLIDSKKHAELANLSVEELEAQLAEA